MFLMGDTSLVPSCMFRYCDFNLTLPIISYPSDQSGSYLEAMMIGNKFYWYCSSDIHCLYNTDTTKNKRMGEDYRILPRNYLFYLLTYQFIIIHLQSKALKEYFKNNQGIPWFPSADISFGSDIGLHSTIHLSETTTIEYTYNFSVSDT